MPERLRERIPVALVAMWAVSLFLPVEQDSATTGFTVLVLGWTGFFEGSFGWLGNPLLLAANLLAALSARRRAAISLGFGVALLFVFLNTALISAIPFADHAAFTFAGPGYYLWMAAVLGTSAWMVARCLLWRREFETI